VRNRGRIPFRELPLVPVGIWRPYIARRIEFCHLLRRETPTCGAEILPQLRLIPRANDNAHHGWPLQKPVESDIGNSLPVSFATSSSASTTRHKISGLM